MAYTSRTVVTSGETKNLSTDFGGETTFEIPSKGTYGGAFQIDAGGTVNSGSSAITFQNNSAVEGGAIFNKGTIELQNNVTFTDNKATSQYGGAIFNFTDATITTANNSTITFTGNSINAASYSVMGGAINSAGTIDFSNSTVYFTNNTIVNTRAGNETFAWGGAVANSGTITFSDVTFSGNTAVNGGAIYNSGTINLKGLMTLADTNQTILNSGTFNWDLTGGTASYGSLAGYALFNNNEKATITVSDNVHAGDSFTIATSDSGFSGCNQTFTLTGMEGTANITIGGAAVEYNDITYTLYTDEDKLILQAGRYVSYTLSESVDTIYDGTAKTVTVTATEPTAGVTAYYSIDGGTTWTEGTSYSITDAGSASVQFKLSADGYLDTITEAATISISKRDVTLTSDTQEAMYDGTVLEGSVTVSGEGFVKDEATATASTLTKVGTIVNEITIDKGEAYKDDNYNITYNKGTLTFTAPDKDTYDLLIANPSFTYEGSLPVASSIDNALRPEDVDVLIAKEGVNNVEFQQDLIDVDKLTLQAADATKTISFLDAYGTKRDDTIRFAKNSNVIFGQTGRVIDLEEGNNKVQVDKGAYATIKSDLVNVSNVKVASDAGESSFADISFAGGRSASLEIGSNTAVSAGLVTGSDKGTTVSIGKNTAFESGAITLSDKGDKITANSGSTVYVGSSEGDVFTGSGIDFGSGNDTLNAKGSNFVAGTVNFGDGNDTLTTGTGSVFAAVARKNGDWATTTDVQYADVSFGDGNDKLSVGKSSAFAASAVNGADTISLGAYSTMQVANITGTKKLTISNGKEGQIATLKASAVTGTAANDSFSLGNWNDVDFASLELGDGNDTLKIGSYADVDINSLDFGEGTKDKLTIGKLATVSVNTLDVNSLDTLSMSKGAKLYLGSASYDAAMETEWGKKYSDQIAKLA